MFDHSLRNLSIRSSLAHRVPKAYFESWVKFLGLPFPLKLCEDFRI